MSHQLAFNFEDRSRAHPDASASLEPVIVRLKKAFSWQSGYQKYPYYLAQADPDRMYTIDEVFTQIFQTGSPRSSRGGGQHDWVNAVFGIEIDLAAREVTVHGIGLVDQVRDDGYRLTEAAVELAQSYARDPAGQDWRRTFAGILARFDVRTRVVLYYLGILGYALHFPGDDSQSGFGTRMSYARLVSSAESIHFLEDARKGAPPPNGTRKMFNQLLDRYPLEILGPFLRGKIEERGLDLSAGVVFQGGKLFFQNRTRVFDEPSTNDLNLYLRQSLSLFMDIGVLAYDLSRRAWAVDYGRAASVFSPEIVTDLFVDRRDEMFEMTLHQAYRALADPEGLVEVRLLRDRVCDALGIPEGQRASYFDRQAARLLSEGRLSLGKTLGWRGSAADALFGDRSKEFVELIY